MTTDDEADAYAGLGFVARRWLQLNEEAGRAVRERLKDEGRVRVRECVGWLRAIGLTEREIINMLHGMAEFIEDELGRGNGLMTTKPLKGRGYLRILSRVAALPPAFLIRDFSARGDEMLEPSEPQF